MVGPRTCKKDLRDLVPMCKFDKRDRWILSLQDSRLNMEIASKVEMLFDRISRGRR
jgi:hypothetical protein